METLPAKVLNEMMGNDLFSRWLGIEAVEIGEGLCILRMTVRKEMLNGFGILHGGVTFSLADSALAFASNSHGRKAVSVEASMSYLKPSAEGDILQAEAREISKSDKIGIYTIEVLNQDNILVAHFKGTVYRTGKEWFPDNKI